MKKKIILIGSAALLVILISVQLAANRSKVSERKKSGNDNFKAVTVSVERVSRREQENRLLLVGTTAAKNEVLVQSQGSGEIVNVNFRIGDCVSRGSLLAKIDDRLMSLALEKARLDLSKTEDEYNKQKNLYSGKAATENQLRDARISFETSKIACEQAKKQLEFTRITAPQNGCIVEKFIERGSLVNPGSQIVRIVDVSQLKIKLNVAEKDVYKIRTGMKVKALSAVHPGVTYSGSVSFVSSSGDQAHNYAVEVEIKNQPSNPLKAGTFASVEFELGTAQNLLLIPRDALVGSIKEAKVYVVNSGTAHQRGVTIGKDYGKYLEVIAGLGEGEEVVTAGQMNLSEGSAVVTIK